MNVPCPLLLVFVCVSTAVTRHFTTWFYQILICVQHAESESDTVRSVKPELKHLDTAISLQPKPYSLRYPNCTHLPLPKQHLLASEHTKSTTSICCIRRSGIFGDGPDCNWLTLWTTQKNAKKLFLFFVTNGRRPRVCQKCLSLNLSSSSGNTEHWRKKPSSCDYDKKNLKSPLQKKAHCSQRELKRIRRRSIWIVRGRLERWRQRAQWALCKNQDPRTSQYCL